MSLFQGAIEQDSNFRSYDGGLFTLNVEDYLSKHAEGTLIQYLDDLVEQCKLSENLARVRYQ